MDVAGAVPDAIRLRKAKSAALRDAVAAGDSEEVVRLLVKGGMHPEGFMESGDSPLLHATRTGQSVIVGLLLASGLDVNRALGDLNSTALHVAVEYRRAEVVWQLLLAGADARKTNLNGQTPLHSAAKAGSAKVVVWLVHAGANLADRDDFGNTPLSIALEHGNDQIVSLLLFAGANPNAEGRDRRTPMHTAAARGELDAVTVLLRAGAHPSPRRAGTGETPLFIAAREGFVTVVLALLSAGAKANEKTNRGLTPLDAAKRNGHHLVARHLGPALHVAGGRQDKRSRRKLGTTGQVVRNGGGGAQDGLPGESVVNVDIKESTKTNDFEDLALQRNHKNVDMVNIRNARPEGGVRIAKSSTHGGSGDGEEEARGCNEANDLEEVIQACLAVRPFDPKCSSARSPAKSPWEQVSREDGLSPSCGGACLHEPNHHRKIDSPEDMATDSVIESSGENETVHTNILRIKMRGRLYARNVEDYVRLTPEPISFAEFVEWDTNASPESFLHENKLWNSQHGRGDANSEAEMLGAANSSKRQDIRTNAVWNRLKLAIMGRSRDIDGQIKELQS